MPIKCCMPIIKIDPGSTNYTPYYSSGTPVVNLTAQPRLDANQAGAVPGLALGLTSLPNPETKRLYAMFPGRLHFWQYGTRYVVRLEFIPPDPGHLGRMTHLNPLRELDTPAWLYRLNRSCIQLAHIDYDGVDAASVRTALLHLVDDNSAWDEFKAFVRRARPRSFVVGTRPGGSGPLHLRNIWRELVEVGGEARIRATLRTMITTGDLFGASSLLNLFPVAAGTWIGNMADRRITLGFQDACGNYLNPIYFFRLLLKWRDFSILRGHRLIEFNDTLGYGAASVISTPSPVPAATAVTIHPLLMRLKEPGPGLTGYLDYLQPTEPIGRFSSSATGSRNIEKYWRLFVPPANALSKISTQPRVQHLVFYGRNGVETMPTPTINEWRLDDYGFIVYRRKEGYRGYTRGSRPWHEETYFSFDFDTAREVTDIYDSLHGAWFSGIPRDFNQVITHYGTPAEMVVSLLARESHGNPAVCGIEPDRDRATTNLSPGFHGFFAARRGPPAQSPLRISRNYTAGSTAVIWSGYPAYGWAQLRDDLNRFTETPSHVSPGLMQTLVATALGCRGDAYIGTLGLRFPGNNAGYMDWLIVPINSIACGIHFLNTVISTRAGTYDPVKLRICYGAGSLLPPTPKDLRERRYYFGYHNSHHVNTGTAVTSAGTNQPWGAYYNAVVAFFNDLVDNPGGRVLPSVRMNGGIP